MQFTQRLREGVRTGQITCSVRIWTRPHVRVGGRYRMEDGEIEIDSIEPIGLPDITPALARASGFLGVLDLLKIAKHGAGQNIYLIRFHYIPPRRSSRRKKTLTPLAWLLPGALDAARSNAEPWVSSHSRNHPPLPSVPPHMSYDLRFALRMILAHRWFSLAVVVTLALGIGLNTMVFTIVNAALFKPVPVPGGARLVSVATHMPEGHDGRDTRISYPDFLDYRAQAHSFEALEGGVRSGGRPRRARHSAPVLPPPARDCRHLLHAPHAPGPRPRLLPSDAQPGAAPVLMIGYAVWQERYAGSPSVIGRQVRINEKPATIIGVMPKGFMFPTTVDLWMPLAPTPNDLKRDNRQLEVFGILHPGVTIGPLKPKSPASPIASPRNTPTPIKTPPPTS